MQGMQALSDTEDALEEVYMDALEQLQNKRQEEKGSIQEPAAGKWKNIMLCGCIRIKNADLRDASAFCRGKNKKQTEDENSGNGKKSVLYDMQQELFWINQYIKYGTSIPADEFRYE